MRGIRARLRPLALAGAALACVGMLAPADAAPRQRDKQLVERMMRHITVLASDDFEGREPGTDGEEKTLAYLGQQWFDIGLVSGTNDPGNAWFAPVTVVARDPAASNAQFFRAGRPHYVARNDVLVLTSGTRSLVRNAPMLFVGKGDTARLSRNDLAGRIALLLDGAASDGARQDALLDAGASAVLTVLDGGRTIDNVAARRKRTGYALADDNPGGDLEAFITREAAEKLLVGSGYTVATLEATAQAADFRPIPMPMSATLEATTNETRIRTHNMIGKLPGKRPEQGAVLLLAHWDHFGVCAEKPAEDLICNGAIDNASGVASLTEIARKLAKGPKLDRDVYFLATTAEELGLLGAHAFAENPPLPLSRIVAAFNIDSNAISPAGEPFGIVGKGMTGLDPQIMAAAKQAKVKVSESDAGNAFVRRQDGWALMQHDIPAVLVSTSYAKIERMERFFDGDYHRPSDGLGNRIELGGAADDVEFLATLTRWFADPKKVPLKAK